MSDDFDDLDLTLKDYGFHMIFDMIDSRSCQRGC